MGQESTRPPVTEHGGPVGWPQLSPYLTMRDADASVKFYAAAFGFELTGETAKDDSGRIQHAGMRLGDAAIMFAPEGASPLRSPASSGAPDSMTIYIYVPDVDALARRAAGAGASTVEEPKDQHWGDRTAVFKCPDGYTWTFATHVAASETEPTPR